ncbi:MAG: maltose alpha-D-glucosyltransferase [Dehalococcoidales bacterium]|nr:maltose alpha-D-glucosyltransferase [Dehalococcoidales bacterium]
METGDSRYFWRDADPLWYKDAIIYELHVRAFYDSNGDGIGDFPGLTEKIDYLQDLGVTAIWLLPFYPSPFKDDGYDVSDYTNIHPNYGTIRDFRILLREANYRGLRIINELVLNHSSDQHPWFQRARKAAPGSEKRDFYVWSDTWDRYKDARIIFKDFESSNWAWDPVAEAYYWHRFYSHQPDLNYDNHLVRQAMFKAIDFWLSLGVSGIRLDAVPYLYEREGTNCENLPETHAFLKELRQQMDQKHVNRMLLAEANQWSEDAVAYFGEGNECHMAYHFPLMPRMFMAIRMEDRFPIVDILQNTPSIPESCQWALFLRNHDELTLEMVTDEERDYMYRVYAYDTQARINLGIRRRLAPLLNNDRKKIELMNGLLFSLPGAPIIYYGDEIGMGDNFYLGDRDGVRTPMQWSADRNAGFSRTNPQRLYLPVNIDPEYHYEAINVGAQQNNQDSLLWWMKRLIALRKRFSAFSRGNQRFLQPENRRVLAFLRCYGDETILVVANLSRLSQHTGLNLSEFIGKVPTEMFGQTEFPVIEGPLYPITLSPYAFYWFSLRSVRLEQIDLSDSTEGTPVTTLTMSRDFSDLYKSGQQVSLESALLRYIRQRYWYGGKSRYARSGQIQDVIKIPGRTTTGYCFMFQIEYYEGEPETYFVPVILAWGENASKVVAEFPQAVVAQLKRKEKDFEEKGVICDALISPDFRDVLLDAVEWHRRFKSDRGKVIAFRTPKIFRRIRGAPGEVLESRLIKGEHANTSVVYGERLKLKMFRRLEEGVSPELEIGRFLTEIERFDNTPPVAGFIEYHASSGEPVTLGVFHRYVTNEGDAWQYTMDSLGRYFEAALLHPDGEIPALPGGSLLDVTGEQIPSLITDTIGAYLVLAQLLAQRTAELHLTLASALESQEFVPEPFSLTYQRSLYHGMRGFAKKVLWLLSRRLQYLPEETKADAEKVLRLENAIIGRFKEITKHKINGMRIRCHGNYHLGHVLYTGDDFIIIDFGGESARRLGERKIKRSPLRDVAGMIRSFHYAAYVALRGQASTVVRPEDIPLLEQWAYAWYLCVSATYVKSYLDLMADTLIIPQNREDMKVIMDTYLLDKAIYELNYELNNRPKRVGLPLRGILQMLEPIDESIMPERNAPKV